MKSLLLTTLFLFSLRANASVTCSGEVQLKKWALWPISTTVMSFGPVQGTGSRENDALRSLYTNIIPYKTQCFETVNKLGAGWCDVEVTDCYGVNGF